MKCNVPRAALGALVFCLPGLAGWAETSQPMPTPFPEARYQRMSAKSPFAVASAASVAAPTPGFAAQLFVDGVARVGKDDFVWIKSRDPAKHMIYLEAGDSTEDGLKVERVKWSDQLRKSTVDVSKGGEKATLLFDGEQTGGQVGVNAPMAMSNMAPMSWASSGGNSGNSTDATGDRKSARDVWEEQQNRMANNEDGGQPPIPGQGGTVALPFSNGGGSNSPNTPGTVQELANDAGQAAPYQPGAGPGQPGGPPPTTGTMSLVQIRMFADTHGYFPGHQQ